MARIIRDSQFPSIQQLLREGIPFKTQIPNYSAPNTNTVNFGDEIATLTHKNEPGRASLITTINTSATGPVQVEGTVFGEKGGNSESNSEILLGSADSYELKYKYIGQNGQVTPYIGGSISGVEFTADYNYAAKKVIGIIGGTTSYSGMEDDPSGNPYPGEYLWCFQITNFFKYLKKSVRLVNKSVKNLTSTKMESLRKSNFYDFDYDLLLVNLGPENSTEIEFKGNISKIISMRNTNRPGVPLVFISCFPTDKNPVQTQNQRDWMQQIATDPVSAGPLNNIWFIDGSNSFGLNSIPTDDINFAISNRSAGNRENYSGFGQALNANKVFIELQTMTWFNDF